MRWVRSIGAGVLTLVAIQVLGSGRGPDQAGALMKWINVGLQKALSPKVAAIPHVAKAPPAKKPSGGASAPDTHEIGTLPRNPSIWVNV